MNEITIEMRRETVADILKEMRDYMDRASYLDCSKGDDDWEYLVGFLDRIEAAHKRETERLHAALKPVLECDIEEQYDGNPFDCLDHNERIDVLARRAVREAQRIYKEGNAE